MLDWYQEGFENATAACRSELEVSVLNREIDTIGPTLTKQWIDGVIDGAEDQHREIKRIRIEKTVFDRLVERLDVARHGVYRGIRVAMVDLRAARGRVEIDIDRQAGQ